MVGRSSAHGFTLLELLIALAIAALVLSIALPNLSRRPGRLQIGAAAHEIAAALRLTRSRAISQNRPALFIADIDSGSYRPASVGASGQVPAGVRLSLYTTRDQSSSGPLASIRFYPDGSSSGGGVALADGGLRYEVLVNWLDGHVSIQETRNARSR